MPQPEPELLQGTLDLLILKSLALEQLHGMGIVRRITQISNGTFQVKAGSLFPALYRMERAGWLASSWGESETKRRAKFYRLTATGRRRLQKESERWERISLKRSRVMIKSSSSSSTRRTLIKEESQMVVSFAIRQFHGLEPILSEETHQSDERIELDGF